MNNELITKNYYQSAWKNIYQKQWINYNRSISKTTMISEKHKLTYCWIHKVASSSWNDFFYKLNQNKSVGFTHLHKAAQKFNPQEKDVPKVTSKPYTRFLFVRHPFERIVSAFVDKFERGSQRDYIFKGN